MGSSPVTVWKSGLTLEQLRIFVAVAEREHVTKAAADLRLTQSAVSAAVTGLEARYDAKLFDRVGRRIVLNDAGAAFLDEARAVLARVSVAETVLTDLAGMRSGRLAVAASQTVANYWLPARLHRFQTTYPAVAVSVVASNSDSIVAMVNDGVVHLGVVEGEVEERELLATAVAEDSMVLIVPPDHPWADGREVRANDLATSRWVVRERGSGTRSVLENLVTGAGLDPRDLDIAIELASNEAVRAAAEAGAGAAVLSRFVVAPSIAAGTLVEVRMPLPKRRFTALRHRHRNATKAQMAFLGVMTTS